MRSHFHDTPVRFRVNHTLVAAAEAKARNEGMSLSELLRQAVRREVREAA
tara:strand:- start:780 stop:929 length:150 start_codon:yes stop_codon:yes gene_type:complete